MEADRYAAASPAHAGIAAIAAEVSWRGLALADATGVTSNHPLEDFPCVP